MQGTAAPGVPLVPFVCEQVQMSLPGWECAGSGRRRPWWRLQRSKSASVKATERSPCSATLFYYTADVLQSAGGEQEHLCDSSISRCRYYRCRYYRCTLERRAPPSKGLLTQTSLNTDSLRCSSRCSCSPPAPLRVTARLRAGRGGTSAFQQEPHSHR